MSRNGRCDSLPSECNAPHLGQRASMVTIASLDTVALETLRLVDDFTGQIFDLCHEGRPIKPALFHQLQLIFPFSREFRRREQVDANASKQGNERDALGGGNQFFSFPSDVLVVDQSFDNRCASRRRAQIPLRPSLPAVLRLRPVCPRSPWPRARSLRCSARRRLRLALNDFSISRKSAFAWHQINESRRFVRRRRLLCRKRLANPAP